MSILFETAGRKESTKDVRFLNNVNTTNLSDYATEYSTYKNQLNIIRKNMNIGTGETLNGIQKKMRNEFNRFLISYPDTQLTKTFGHVFFTRPCLNLFSDPGSNTTLLPTVASDPLFAYLYRDDPDILRALTSGFSNKHAFNPYLSNLAMNFELKDDSLEVVDTGETFTGFKVRYGRHNIKNRTADSFSIKYREDSDYGIYKTHKAWTEYISKVYRGYFNASEYNIQRRVIDYACSVYFILCGPDGETILFWSKYTGVFPSAAPSSYSSWEHGNPSKFIEYSIPYEYSWKEDFNPLHVVEFNIQAVKGDLSQSNNSQTYLNVYDKSICSTGRTFSARPFIQSITDSDGRLVFKLRYAPSAYI